MEKTLLLPEKAKILVVDDEPVVLRLIDNILKKQGHEIYTADKGSNALKILNEISIDILITDINMPKMDGIQLIHEAKKIIPEVLVMVITGFPEIDSAISLLKSGVYDYIAKPIHSDKVVASVDRGWKRQMLAYENKHLLQNLKLANEALKISNESFNNIVNKSIDGVLVLDQKGIVRFINPSAEILFNRRSDEIMGELFGFPFVADGMMDVDILRSGGEKGIAEMRVIDTEWDGENALLALLRDVTERNQADTDLKQSVENLRKALGGIIHAMAAVVEIRDPYTAGHQQRVANLARSIGTEMGLSQESIDGIRMAGVIHDIGKIAVPAEILSKPGRLNVHEFGLIKSHPMVGYEILKSIEFPWPIARLVLQHHERIDGSGYPYGLSGDEILMEAKVLAVADVVEAIASHRPYRAALGIEMALDEILRNKGAIYEPEVVDACLRLFNEKGFKL